MREYEKRCKERKEYLRQRGREYAPQLIHDLQMACIKQQQEEEKRQLEERKKRTITAYLASQPWI